MAVWTGVLVGRAAWDPVKHPRDARGRFVRKGALQPGTSRDWETLWTRTRARDLQPGDSIGAYRIEKVEHGSKPHTTRLIMAGGGRITLRDNYHVRVQRHSHGGEAFFSENKTLHYDDPGIRDLTSAFGKRLHVGEDGKGWDTRDVQQHLRGLKEVPAAHRRFLGRSHVEVYVGTEAVTKQDDLGYLSTVHPTGYPEGDTYDQCGGLFQWPRYDTTRKPEFGKTYNPPMTQPAKIVLGVDAASGSVNTAAHETGHALDKFLGEDVFFRGTGDLDMTNEFTRVYQRFASKSDGGLTWVGDPYYLQDAEHAGTFGFNRGRSEFFAETYAAWVHTRTRPSQFRAEEIMDAVGMHLKTFRVIYDKEGHYAGMEEGLQQDPASRRKAARIRRELGNELIAFYDGLDARIATAVKRLPPPREKARP